MPLTTICTGQIIMKAPDSIQTTCKERIIKTDTSYRFQHPNNSALPDPL